MTFKTVPYKHQEIGFNQFKDKEYGALFCDMGTGKSKIAIDLCVYNYEKKRINACLIIAPNGVHQAWMKEQFPLHCSIPYMPFVWKSVKVGTRFYQNQLNDFLVDRNPMLKVLSINVEAFQFDACLPFIAEYVKNHKPFIIVDEATRIKHNTAKRSKIIHKLNKYGIRFILTGTPTAKSPFDLWSQFEFLKANYFDCNYFVFQHRYGILAKGYNERSGAKFQTLIDEKQYKIVRSKIEQFAKMRGSAGLMPADYEAIAVTVGTSEKNIYFIEAHPEYTQFKNLDKLREVIAKDVYSVRKQDCLDLPPKVYESIFVEMSKEQTRVYKNLKRELEVEYEGTVLTVANKVALTTRLMQITGGFFPFATEKAEIIHGVRFSKMVADSKPITDTNVKLNALLDDLEELSDESQVIIWAAFVPELKMLYQELKKKYSCCLYYGGTSQAKREEFKIAFQKGQYKIFIGNAATAGFGLNLQNAPFQYFFSNTFKTEDRLQAEDRSHRNGVKTTVVCKDIIVKGTVDELIYKNIATGRNLNDFFKSVSLKEILHTEEEERE